MQHLIHVYLLHPKYTANPSFYISPTIFCIVWFKVMTKLSFINQKVSSFSGNRNPPGKMPQMHKCVAHITTKPKTKIYIFFCFSSSYRTWHIWGLKVGQYQNIKIKMPEEIANKKSLAWLLMTSGRTQLSHSSLLRRKSCSGFSGWKESGEFLCPGMPRCT